VRNRSLDPFPDASTCDIAKIGGTASDGYEQSRTNFVGWRIPLRMKRLLLLAAAMSGVCLVMGPLPIRAAASRTHTQKPPRAIRPHRVIFESAYYQNASKAGGTALAEFPEARVRYGALQNLEVFYDAPSEIAKSGLKGTGVYYKTHSGYGMNYEIARTGLVSYSLSGEINPPLSALANTRLKPASDVDIAATWFLGSFMQYKAQVGTLDYTEDSGRTRHRSSPMAALFATRSFDTKTFFTAGFDEQSRAYFGTGAQTSGIVGVRRELSQQTLVNVEVGSAFNAAGRSKPHYLAFGFVAR
jgi:hypothetical protein